MTRNEESGRQHKVNWVGQPGLQWDGPFWSLSLWSYDSRDLLPLKILPAGWMSGWGHCGYATVWLNAAVKGRAVRSAWIRLLLLLLLFFFFFWSTFFKANFSSYFFSFQIFLSDGRVDSISVMALHGLGRSSFMIFRPSHLFFFFFFNIFFIPSFLAFTHGWWTSRWNCGCPRERKSLLF